MNNEGSKRSGLAAGSGQSTSPHFSQSLQSMTLQLKPRSRASPLHPVSRRQYSSAQSSQTIQSSSQHSSQSVHLTPAHFSQSEPRQPSTILAVIASQVTPRHISQSLQSNAIQSTPRSHHITSHISQSLHDSPFRFSPSAQSKP